MADPIFENPRLAAIYDHLDGDRRDLDAYIEMVDEFGATSVLDVGCGTGTLACLLAERGVEVVAVDPALASLEVAKAKAGADHVRWIHGTAGDLPDLQVDLAFMTANVAQVFLTDDEWMATLSAISNSLSPGGRLVFETRDPRYKAWSKWNRENTHRRVDVPGIGVVETWCDLLDVSDSLITFRWTYIFDSDGASIESESTLRFRNRAEVERSLTTAGFTTDEVRDAPDGHGRELVFVARLSRTTEA
jgi:SAM-dependent methyltransferase